MNTLYRKCTKNQNHKLNESHTEVNSSVKILKFKTCKIYDEVCIQSTTCLHDFSFVIGDNRFTRPYYLHNMINIINFHFRNFKSYVSIVIMMPSAIMKFNVKSFIMFHML